MDKSYSLLKKYKKWCPYKGEGYKGKNKTAKINLADVFHIKTETLCYEGDGSTQQTNTHKRQRERDPSSTKLKIQPKITLLKCY